MTAVASSIATAEPITAAANTHRPRASPRCKPVASLTARHPTDAHVLCAVNVGWSRIDRPSNAALELLPYSPSTVQPGGPIAHQPAPTARCRRTPRVHRRGHCVPRGERGTTPASEGRLRVGPRKRRSQPDGWPEEARRGGAACVGACVARQGVRRRVRLARRSEGIRRCWSASRARPRLPQPRRRVRGAGPECMGRCVGDGRAGGARARQRGPQASIPPSHFSAASFSVRSC